MNRSQETARIVEFALEQDRLEKQADAAEFSDDFDPDDAWDLFRIREEEAREQEERNAMMEAEYDDAMRSAFADDYGYDRYDDSFYDLTEEDYFV